MIGLICFIVVGLAVGFAMWFSHPPSSQDKHPMPQNSKTKARNFLSNLKPGDAVTVLVKDDIDTKKCFVKENMPSLSRIELQYKYNTLHGTQEYIIIHRLKMAL